MNFTSFDKLIEMGIPRPSLALEGILFWSKLHDGYLMKRDNWFTTIRAKGKHRYKVGQKVQIHLDHTKAILFEATIINVRDIRKHDITKKLARGDADMTVDEMMRYLDFLYLDKHGDDPQLEIISMRKIDD